MNRQRKCLCYCGGCCLVSAIIVAALWSTIFLALVSWQFSLSPHTIAYGFWKETPVPQYMNVFLFNWTNPNQSLHGQEKPAFSEMGPYVFSEHHSKRDIQWNDNDTVTFLNRNEWHFMPNMSNGSLNDVVTNFNTVAMTLGSRCYNLGNLTPIVDEIFLEEGSLVVSKTVQELIFDGYEDPLLQNSDLRQYLPDFPTYDKFGWFYGRNMSATYDGVITMYTGASDIEKLGIMTSWNYKNRTGCYPGDCGKVQTTIGNVLPLSTFKYNQFSLFNTDICGAYEIDYEKPVEMYGLPGIQYHGSEAMFSNNQTCYCPQPSCPAPGVRDMTVCRQAPLFISLPHFLHADSSYLDAISGLQPNASLHSFYMSLANLTSVPLVVRARLQTNLLMQPIPNMTFFSNLSWTYMPMFWSDQYALLTADLASLMAPLYTAASHGRWLILAFGCSLGLFLMLLGKVLRCQDSDLSLDHNDHH